MKDRIIALAKGKMSHGTVKLQVSEKRLRLFVVSGKEEKASFVIRNSRGTKVKGFICSDEYIIPMIPIFYSIENHIEFKVSAKGKKIGEIVEGMLHIISDCGQVDLPYRIDVIRPVLKDESGIIDSDLTLMERIRADYEEGAKLFYSEEFEQVFLSGNEAGKLLYHQLTAHNTRLQGMEEFLAAFDKKDPVRFSVRKNRYTYMLDDHEVEDVLSITTNTWGSASIRISSTHEAIIPEHIVLWTDDFIGQTMNLSFIVNGSKIKEGKHTGNLVLESSYEKKIVTIEMRKTAGEAERKNKRKQAKYIHSFFKNIILFELKKISMREFSRNMKAAISGLKSYKHPLMSLIRGYYLVMTPDAVEEGEETIDEFILNINKSKKPDLESELNAVLIYAAGLYFRFLYLPEEDESESAAKEIYFFYENGYRHWVLFYFLLKMNSEYRTLPPHMVLEEIEEHIREGCNSPFLYIEAIRIYCQDISLLTELKKEHIQVIYYGLKEDMFDRDFAMKLSYLTDSVKYFSFIYLRCLAMQYEKYQMDSTLHSICSYLIRNEMLERKHFSWYALGVKKCLRIIDLFEYYMNTLKLDAGIRIPQTVISYFQYENHLSDSRKAFLYASVLSERMDRPQNFRVYSDTIREFAHAKLKTHSMSRDMGIIYEMMIGKTDCKGEIAEQLPHVMFKYLLTCRNPNMEGVRVIHLESRKEDYYTLNSGKALVDLYTKNYQIYFIDREQHYYMMVDYTLEPLIHPERFASNCFENGSNHPHLLLYLLSGLDFGHVVTMSDAILYDMAAKEEILRPAYQGKILYALYQYAANHREDEFLVHVLERIDPEYMKPEWRAEYFTSLVNHHFYEKAYQLIEKYGIYKYGNDALFTLATWYVRDNKKETTIFAQRLCYQLFRDGFRNPWTVSYLVQNYMGKTRDLLDIFEDAEKRGIKLDEQAKERLLAQVLFVGENPEPFYSLYCEYDRTGENRLLARAFLNQTAFCYVTDKIKITAEILEIIKRESIYEENTIVILALLKYLSNVKNPDDKQCKLADYHISHLAKEGVVMKFMQQFPDEIGLPYELRSMYLVQHFSDTKLPVSVRTTDARGNVTEDIMRSIYPGIFVKEVMVFEGETFYYQVIEEETGKAQERMPIKHEYIPKEKSFFSTVNQMSDCLNKGDREGYKEACIQYKTYEMLAAKLFQIR
ncbi:MAG: DUF5717 family protein [Lachnoclostridium sp.]|nr:DUF5717 family protein [Lachnoclostridium sp.]